MLYRMEGIVIRSTDYGEGNKIVTLITPTHGKQGVVARGARKPKSRFASLTQLFTYGDYAYFKTGGLGTLSSGEIIESFRELRENLELAAWASYAAELADRALSDEEASGYMFYQVKACLSALAQGKDPEVLLRVLEMKIAAAAGYEPVLRACAACGREEGPFRFSAAAGGALCAACRHRDPSAIELDESVWKLLRLFAAIDLRRLGAVDVKEPSKRQLKAAMRSWLDTHLGLRLKSQTFLDQMERIGGLRPDRNPPPSQV
jgi:DNA repair protein RecO (recombination protein O)